MKSDHTPTSDCGCSSQLWIYLLIGAAFFLTLLAGLLLAGGMALMWFIFAGHTMAPAGAAAPVPPPVMPTPDLFGFGQLGIGVLLAGAVLLLLLILILLIVLLFCSCGQPKWIKELLKFLPMLKDIRTALIATADALLAMEQGLRAAKTPVEAAGRLLKEAGEQVNVPLPVVSPHTTHFNLIDADVVTGFDYGTWQPFSEVRNKLSDTGAKLKDSPDGLSSKLDDVADRCHDASVALRSIANVIPIP